jgi:hypothetical protein
MFETIYEVEHAIQELINKDNNCSAHFKYTRRAGRVENRNCKNAILAPSVVTVDLVTYNPKHKTHFLLHSMTAATDISATNALYTHIYNLKKTLEKGDSGYVNYTIEWSDKNGGKTQYSSFYGTDLEDVVRKFFYGKSKKSLNIFNIKLNPMT